MNILSHRFAEKQLRAVRDVEQQLFFHFPSMESVWDPQAGGNHCCCCMLEHLFHRMSARVGLTQWNPQQLSCDHSSPLKMATYIP
ncbi:hypothetical protein NC652_023053 [Populus alba x Populus x berolinensis]|nr:hypothetical protein NC652_023053 [Populus alba x Populus x berolinensis]